MAIVPERLRQLRDRLSERRLVRNEVKIGAISDLHWEASNVHKAENLVNEVLANKDFRALLLAGDVVNKTATVGDIDKVLKQLGRLRDPGEAKRDIPVVVVEGNDEVSLHPTVREYFYRGLTDLGVHIFKPDTHNVLTIHGGDGKPLASFVGIPWTLPPEEFKKIRELPRAKFLPEYDKKYRQLYEQYVTEAIREAKKRRAPIYLVFHVPPLAEHYNFRRRNTQEDADKVAQIMRDNLQSWIIRLIKKNCRHIAGMVAGHISEGISRFVKIAGTRIVAVNICQEVVTKQEGEQMFVWTLSQRRGTRHAQEIFHQEANAYGEKRPPAAQTTVLKAA